jgi:hypothetical protein
MCSGSIIIVVAAAAAVAATAAVPTANAAVTAVLALTSNGHRILPPDAMAYWQLRAGV